MQYTLDDAVDINKEYPDTFFIPSEDQVGKLEAGDLVKLIFREPKHVERMWVVISEINKDKNSIKFSGILDNSPYYLTSIKLGDVVTFTSRNIIQIY